MCPPAVYGTVVVSDEPPRCYVTGDQRNHVEDVLEAMVYTTWAFTILAWYVFSSSHPQVFPYLGSHSICALVGLCFFCLYEASCFPSFPEGRCVYVGFVHLNFANALVLVSVCLSREWLALCYDIGQAFRRPRHVRARLALERDSGVVQAAVVGKEMPCDS